MYYITKDFNHLFNKLVKNGDENQTYGFDLLDDSNLVKVNPNELIEIKSGDNKLFKQLITNDLLKLEIAESHFKTDSQQATFLGLSERTLYRMKKDNK